MKSKIRGPNTGPCGTTEFSFLQSDVRPFKSVYSFLSEIDFTFLVVPEVNAASYLNHLYVKPLMPGDNKKVRHT